MTEVPKKKSKGFIGIAIMLVVALVVNIACAVFQTAINSFMAANLNPIIMGQGSSGIESLGLTPEQATEASREITRELEAEGLVLLQNEDDVLPLEEGAKVNLFGYATVSPIYGGTGSGASDTSNNVDLVQGLTDAGFEVNQELVDFYNNSGVSRGDQSGFEGANFTPAEVPASEYSDELMSSARDFSDVAVVMLSRIGGEGGDLPQDMQAAGFGDDSRSYLELTQDEEDLLALIEDAGFERVVLLINSSNAMELGFVEDSGIDSVMWVGGTGSTGFSAVGDALCGKVNPSGRLTDTYAYDHSTAPAYWNAGDFTYSNMDNYNYVEYQEGIYVGYRFYETRWVDNATGEVDEAAYDEMVQYPFGYGLSYTTFEQSIKDFQSDDETITMAVTVKNTGDVAGKDVVQVYYTAPYTEGGIEKSHVVLAGFGKTEMLEPGAEQDVTVSFAVADMASYDYAGEGCYVLDAGDYAIKLMSNAHDVIDERSYTVAERQVFGEGNARPSDGTAATNHFDDVTNGQITTYVSRADWEGTLPTERVDGKEASDEVVNAITGTPTYEDDPDAEPIVIADHGITLEDMAGVPYDDPKWDEFIEQLSVDDMVTLVSNGGWSTAEIESVGKPATTEIDGPAGLNSLTSGFQGVAFPAEVVIGSTWNEGLVEAFGQTFGAEAAANHVSGLYAPGANIHRTPYSGRNFEYYGEDALLSGKMAAAQIRGLSSQGVYSYIKHFALNDQEANRLSISVWSNEQAMREIYLKPFEIAVKEGDTTAIMSSYSRLGSTWAGASKALLTDVLRGEWGFQGTVVTDSAMGNTSWMDVNLGIRAGNDLMLCLMGVNLDTSTNTAQQALRAASKNILYTQANSVAVQVATDSSPYWVFLLAAVDAAVLAVLVLWLLRNKSLKTPAKVGIGVGVAAATVLVFWLIFFSGIGSSSAPSGDDSTEQGTEQSAEPEADADAEPAEGAFLQMEGTGVGEENAWLLAHVALAEDGTFTITIDYGADNAGIETDSGTWEKSDDGTITLAGDKRELTATTADGTTYEMEFDNTETSIPVKVTGTVGGSGSAPAEGTFLQMEGAGVGEENAWLLAHVTLAEDGTFTITIDYGADNAGIETDSGTWEKSDDGTITLAGDKRELTATTADGTTYEMEFDNTETSIPVKVTGTAGGGSGSAPAAPVEGAFLQMEGAGIGEENAWLLAHVTLAEDGTFEVVVDYGADHAGNVTDSGTWTKADDGTITLAGDKRELTATTADGTTYEMEFDNTETSIPVKVTGTAAA